MRGTFVLNLHDLDSAGKTFTDEIGVAWLRGTLEDCDVEPASPPGKLALRYSKTGTDVVVTGTATATLTAPCSRCLEPATFEVTGEISLLLVPETSKRAKFAQAKVGPAHEELSPEEIDLDTYSGEEVVLDRFVRDALVLEVPPFPLCSEDCQGIRPPPDAREDVAPSIDPRLAPLLELSAKQKKNDRKDLTVAVPKRRTTRAKSKMRRAQHDKVTPVTLQPCANCGEPSLPHRVCASCGFYKGAKVVEKLARNGAFSTRARHHNDGPFRVSIVTQGEMRSSMVTGASRIPTATTYAPEPSPTSMATPTPLTSGTSTRAAVRSPSARRNSQPVVAGSST
jgi:uncharacterized protein